MWPQIIVVILFSINVTSNLVKLSKKQKTNLVKYDAFLGLAGSCTMIALLYFGGYFNCFFHVS